MKTNTFAALLGMALFALTLGGAQAGINGSIISGTKFEDVNGNGQRDMGIDVPFAGVTINLLDDNSIVIDAQVTDANGEYSFTILEPGTYAVAEDLSSLPLPGRNEVVATTPTQISGILVDFNGNSETTGIDFGNAILGSFHGLKFLDDDGDGFRDPDESGLSGIEFLLNGIDGQGNTISSSVLTDDDGHFWFEGLLPGDYTIMESLIDDLLLTTLPNQRNFTLLSGQELVFEDGAAILPPNSLRNEVNVGDELVWGNTRDVPVPEPATLALMSLGLAGLGYRRRRQIKAA